MSIELLLGAVAIVALFVWLARRGERTGGRDRPPTGAHRDPDIDYDELEAAEREVRDLDTDQRPEDGFEGDDWGPGTARPPERR